jgi:hypothetical protein
MRQHHISAEGVQRCTMATVSASQETVTLIHVQACTLQATKPRKKKTPILLAKAARSCQPALAQGVASSSSNTKPMDNSP